MTIPRLNSLKRLKLRNTSRTGGKQKSGPCATEVAGLLGCWASSGGAVDNQACEKFAMALTNCMKTHKPEPKRKETINYHLARLYPLIKGR